MSTKDTNPKDAISSGKLPLSLLSPIAKAFWAVAQFSGLIKYGAWNWRRAGVRGSVYASAARRHLDAYDSGEDHDPVDGTHHLGNVMACCAIILDARAAGKLTDDRPPSVTLRPTYAECEAVMLSIKKKYAEADPRHYDIRDTEPKPPVTLLPPVIEYTDTSPRHEPIPAHHVRTVLRPSEPADAGGESGSYDLTPPSSTIPTFPPDRPGQPDVTVLDRVVVPTC